jgi:hypothetical protein
MKKKIFEVHFGALAVNSANLGMFFQISAYSNYMCEVKKADFPKGWIEKLEQTAISVKKMRPL